MPVHVRKTYRGSRGIVPLIHSLGQHHSPAPVSSAKNTGTYSGTLGGTYSRLRPPYHPACRLVAIWTALCEVPHRNAKSVQKCFGVQDNILKGKEIFLFKNVQNGSGAQSGSYSTNTGCSLYGSCNVTLTAI